MSHGRAPTGAADDTRVRHALLLMEQRLSDPMPIHELAARLSLSTRHVERLFQGVVGAKPRTVYRRMRLRHAHWMLANTRCSITSIAIDTGFSDGAHFSRQFKQMTGVSPSAARQSLADTWQPDPALSQFDDFELACQDATSGCPAPPAQSRDPVGGSAIRTCSPKPGGRPESPNDNQNRRSGRTHAGESQDEAADFGRANTLKGNFHAQSSFTTQ